MILREENDRMLVASQVCQKHLKRMDYAHSKIKKHFPLTLEVYKGISMDEFSFFDQFIFRFSKLQDCMSNKLLRYILESLAENTRNLSFIDLLAKGEQLEILLSADHWMHLRLIRNKLAHEYPSEQKETINELNQLIKTYEVLLENWEHLEAYIKKKFGYLF